MQLVERNKQAILLVDDEPFIRDVIRSSLHQIGYKNVMVCESAEAARDKLRAVNFNLIISDINLGGKSGLSLVQDIRCGETNIDYNVPIILLTGNGDRATVDAAVTLEVNAFIAKPATVDTLKTKVDRCFLRPKKIDKPLSKENARVQIEEVNKKFDQTELEKAKPGLASDAEIVWVDDEPPSGSKCLMTVIEDLEPGMTLGQSVTDANGRLLLASDIVLKESHISRLRTADLRSNFVKIQVEIKMGKR